MVTPATLLREARARSGLSQRALARRAGTAQSVVARIELGETSPSWDTLLRLLRAAGVTLNATVVPRRAARSHMLADVPRILGLPPEARLTELGNLSRFLSLARRTSA
ncbi:MAG TPA: helix-turn-helix transcriptional regulator [Gemmatimonadales bacterium]|nr:helix-turn-helix transcriptional regulator [Gemmatimonadales bacterium]